MLQSREKAKGSETDKDLSEEKGENRLQYRMIKAYFTNDPNKVERLRSKGNLN